jgi:hypothetical protein
VRRLAGVMEQEMAMREVFGGSVGGRVGAGGSLSGSSRRRGSGVADVPGPELA